MMLDYIFLGSQNPSKKKSVSLALSNLSVENDDIKIQTFSVDSQVSDQPKSNAETKEGSINRARHALELGQEFQKETDQNYICCGIGIESGVYELGKNAQHGQHCTQMWTTGWVSLFTLDGSIFSSQGGGFLLPEAVANEIRQGKSLAQVMDSISQQSDVRSKQGAIGVFTDNLETRASIYTPMVRIVLGLWLAHNQRQKRKEGVFYKEEDIKSV